MSLDDLLRRRGRRRRAAPPACRSWTSTWSWSCAARTRRALPRHGDPPAGLPGLPGGPRRRARGGAALRRTRCHERTAALTQRRRPARGRVGGQDRPHGDLEGAGRRSADGAADQHRRRRPGRPAGARRRAPRGVRLPARLLPLLGARARPRRLHLRAVRRELHGGRACADDEVCIGDRYRIGGALFEVTQPRVTCYRAGDPDGRPGDAARCSSPTTARASISACSRRARSRRGDEIVKVADGPERLTSQSRRAALPAGEVAARCSSARCACRRSARAGRGASATCSPRRRPAAPAWAGFRPLRVAEVRRESDDDHVVPARTDRRGAGAAGAPGPVPHGPRASRRRAAGAQLLAL